MPKQKESSIELSLKEKAVREREQCERAILNRLYAAPARIEELDKHRLSQETHQRRC